MNRRPAAYKAAALPTELHQHFRSRQQPLRPFFLQGIGNTPFAVAYGGRGGIRTRVVWLMRPGWSRSSHPVISASEYNLPIVTVSRYSAKSKTGKNLNRSEVLDCSQIIYTPDSGEPPRQFSDTPGGVEGMCGNTLPPSLERPAIFPLPSPFVMSSPCTLDQQPQTHRPHQARRSSSTQRRPPEIEKGHRANTDNASVICK